MPVILIVDDVAAMAEQYAYDLRRLGGHETLVSSSGSDALDVLTRESVDCVILDLEMPGMDGFAVLRSMKEHAIDVPVIVYTGTGSFDRCVQALRLGAYTFIDKADPLERVAREVEAAIERRALVAEVTALRRHAADDSALAGGSAVMTKLRDAIARVAPIPSPVLILGESGSGKELVARDLHRLSGHEKEPFVAVNCAALPDALVESELFGHERGAFTGAIATRKGAFEAAGKGTIFLDEVGEIPLDLQSKLLRVLQESEYERVGDDRTHSVNVRVVAATNRDLERAVEEGRFREDLYYRLSVFPIDVPPLRERGDDVVQIASHFLERTCQEFGHPPLTLSRQQAALLKHYDWPGNIRELKNVIERAVILSRGKVLRLDLAMSDILSTASDHEPAQAPAAKQLLTDSEVRELERKNMVAALELADWRISGPNGAARLLGVKPTTLADRIRKFQITRTKRPRT